MLRLTNTTTDLLKITTTANGARVMVDFSDKTSAAYTGGNQPTSITSATTTTICSTPAASTVRDIDHVAIRATAANTITVIRTVSATDYEETQAVLATGETLEYTHADGWRTKDANGVFKYTQSGVAVASGKTLTVSNTLTLAGTDATVMTFPTTNATIARTDSAQTFTGVQTFTSPSISGTVATTGLTLPAFILSGNMTSTGNPSINTGSGAISGGAITANGAIYMPASAGVTFAANRLALYQSSAQATFIATGNSDDAAGRGTYQFYGYGSAGAAQLSYLSIAATGAVTIPNLAGVGSRTVVVDANGVLSAP